VEEEPSLTGKKELAFLEIPLQINNKPLLLTGLPGNHIQVVVSAKGIVISLKQRLYDASWQEFKEVTLISLEKAQELISKSEGVMIANSSQEGLSSTILSYELNHVSLAYYGKNEKDQYLQPIYIFGGKGALEGNIESNVLLYLLALEY